MLPSQNSSLREALKHILPKQITPRNIDEVFISPKQNFANHREKPISTGDMLKTANQAEALITETSEGWEDPRVELQGQSLPTTTSPAFVNQQNSDKPALEACSNCSENSTEAFSQPSVIMGYDLAEELGVKLEDTIQLITPVPRITPLGLIPGVLLSRVGGLYDINTYDFARTRIYANLENVQAFIKCGDRISGFDLRVRANTPLASTLGIVQQTLAQHNRADLVIITWTERQKNFLAIAVGEKIMLTIILLCTAVIAGFGILASQWIAVLERTHEISILRAMGCRPRQIGQIFCIEGSVLGILGSCAGIFAGIIFLIVLAQIQLPLADRFFGLAFLPVQINPVHLIILGVSAFFFIWLASSFPAWKASSLPPIEGLKNLD